MKDLTPVALVMVVPNVLVVGPSVTAKDVKELVAQMKAKPDSFNYASSGAGSTQHLAGEAFKKLAGVQMTHIPYKGSAQAHADLLGGQAQIMFDTTSSAIGQIKGGKLRALAVTSPKRSPELPDVPTLAEAGFPGTGNDHLVRRVRAGGNAQGCGGQAVRGNHGGAQIARMCKSGSSVSRANPAR